MATRILNVPNLLTISRLLCLPVIVFLSRGGHAAAAAGVFLLGMATDAVDGWLATRLGQRTTFGLYLDPVVDKAVILCLLYELSAEGALNLAVAHLFLVRELLHSGVRSAAAAQGTVVGANMMGKVKALLQTALVAWGLILPLADPGAAACAFRVAAAAVLVLSWLFTVVFVWRNRELIGLAPGPRPGR